MEGHVRGILFLNGLKVSDHYSNNSLLSMSVEQIYVDGDLLGFKGTFLEVCSTFHASLESFYAIFMEKRVE